LGNWADRIDELESENFDLGEENEALNDEIADLLFEKDRLVDRLYEMEEELATARRETELARLDAAAWESTYEYSEILRGEVQARANSWFEIAKQQVRAREFWLDIADKYSEQLDAALNDYDELQTALRVLGGKER
jgi:chromosome segregation ATPase